MIRKAWRAVDEILGSARLAIGLLVFVGIWSAIATAVPQGEPTASLVTEWAARNGALESVIGPLGLHQAFAAPVFLAAAVLLGISTAVCSVRRTRSAMARTRVAREAATADAAALRSNHDFVLDARGLAADQLLETAAQALEQLGFRIRRSAQTLNSNSPWWSLWGSAVFHWSLVALMATIGVGALVRAEGSIAIAVGDTKPDQPGSYVSVTSGPWHDWSKTDRAFRVDAFDPAYVADGMDRGAVPTVSVLDASGAAIVTQAVYPNSKLHLGSLSVHAPTCGLAITLAIIDEAGVELTRLVQLVDFSQEAPGGTVPVQPLMLTDGGGQVLLRLYATVPLDQTDAATYGEWIPKNPTAQVHLADGAGVVLADGIVGLGRDLPITNGGLIRLVDVGWYSRLVAVDDPTIPFVYGTMVLALLGLTMSLAGPQRVLVAAAEDSEAGSQLYLRLRLWRNNPATREELEEVLSAALRTPEGPHDTKDEEA